MKERVVKRGKRGEGEGGRVVKRGKRGEREQRETGHGQGRFLYLHTSDFTEKTTWKTS